MVGATKGRVNSIPDRVKPDRKMSNTMGGGVRDFKIYTDSDKVRIGGEDVLNKSKKKSVTCNEGISQVKAGVLKNDTRALEKNKGKVDGANTDVERKILADISNVKGSFSRSQLTSGARPVKGKTEILKQKRDAVGLGARKASSSDKSLAGSVRSSLSLSSTENKSLNRTANKNVISSSPELGTKDHGFNTKKTTGRSFSFAPRTSLINPRPPTRKSLPAVKQIAKEETSETKKENSDKLEKSSGKHGFPVKPRVSRNILPHHSNSGTHRWRTRGSDGGIITASKPQSKLDARLSSRNSLKPIVKTSILPGTGKNSSLKFQLSINKSRSNADTSSLTKKVINQSSLSGDVESVVSNEQPTEKELALGSNSKSGTSDAIARSKSERRNSYTCLLMSRSKLLKEGHEAIKEENLPNIYDDRNHLEVSDYVDDIYQYYWVMEAQNPLLKNYLESQTEITPQMRGILINWLIEVHLKFDLMPETLFLTVTLLDRYLSLERIEKNDMQLVGLTALLLASKYEDFWHPRVTDLITISAESYTRDQMLKMEKAILKKLKFRLNEPTLYVFMLRFLKAAQSDTKFEHLAFYLIELCLIEYEALHYKPSALCASAIYLARCTMKMTPAWTPLLEKHARYHVSHIRDCAEMILRFQKAANTSLLKVTYEKYMKPDCSRVAAIKPLDMLPV